MAKVKGESREWNAGAQNALIRCSHLDSGAQNMTLPAPRRFAATSESPYYQIRASRRGPRTDLVIPDYLTDVGAALGAERVNILGDFSFFPIRN